MKKSPANHILIPVIAGFAAGAVAFFLFSSLIPQSSEDLIEEFYQVENAVHVSPHSLRKHIDTVGDTVTLVDLRSQEEYETAHIIGAISIPAYATPDKSDYDATDRIIGAFKAIPKDQEIVVYCYSLPCMTGRKIGQMLAENGIYVKHLGIGWNEWRYDWGMWNHDGESPVNPKDYVSSGSEPGIFVGEGGTACPIEGDYGC